VTTDRIGERMVSYLFTLALVVTSLRLDTRRNVPATPEIAGIRNGKHIATLDKEPSRLPVAAIDRHASSRGLLYHCRIRNATNMSRSRTAF
jgi:hypothetical protein